MNPLLHALHITAASMLALLALLPIWSPQDFISTLLAERWQTRLLLSATTVILVAVALR